jgi:hypothetical protein
MDSTNKKSVCIEGDRAMFSSKGAVDRFKRDLRVNDQEKLKAEDYFREGWTYQVVSSNESEIKVKLVNVQDIAQQARVLDCDERRKMLKNKLKQMREQKQSPSKIKLAMKNKVPEDILNAYLNLKKYNVNVAIPRPDEVLEKQPFTYEEIQNLKQKEFDSLLKSKQNEFESLLNSVKPTTPNFSFDKDKEIEINSSIDQLINDKINQRNSELQNINNELSYAEKWLSSNNTSIKSEKNQAKITKKISWDLNPIDESTNPINNFTNKLKRMNNIDLTIHEINSGSINEISKKSIYLEQMSDSLPNVSNNIIPQPNSSNVQIISSPIVSNVQIINSINELNAKVDLLQNSIDKIFNTLPKNDLLKNENIENDL